MLLRTANGLTPLAPVQLPDSAYEFGIIDVDRDGKLDLVIHRSFAQPGNGPITSELLMYGQGAKGVFTLNAALTAQAVGFCQVVELCTDMRVADLNADGKAELIFGGVSPDRSQQLLAYNYQAGTGLVKTLQLNLGSMAKLSRIADFNGDKILDLMLLGVDLSVPEQFFATLTSPGLTPILEGRTQVRVADTVYPYNIALADVDRDGKLDIVFNGINSGIVLSRRTTY